jgi:hypothetical protein
MKGEIKILFSLSDEPIFGEVMEFNTEWRQALENRETDSASSYCPDLHSFEVIGTTRTVGYVPTSF